MKNFAIFLVSILTIVFVFTSCNNAASSTESRPLDASSTVEHSNDFVSVDAHEHAFGEWSVSKEPTCTEEGERVRSCECGETERETIAKTEHEFENGICKICGLCKTSEGLAYAKNGNYYIVTGIGECPDKDVYIPDKYDCLPVLEIAENAFDNCLGIESIHLPEGLISICDNAFSNCLQLKEVYISNSVERIGKNVFKGCSAIFKMSIPFVGDKQNVNHFGYFFDSESKDNNCVPITISEVIILDSCEIIPYKSFLNCKGLKSVIISDGVKEIGECAFKQCSALEQVYFGKGVVKAGREAFEACNALKAVYIEDIGAWCSISFDTEYVSNPLYIAKNLYLNGNIVTQIVIPQGVASIGSGVFDGCEKLESITIPDSVVSIGASAFRGCEKLESVIIPEGVTTINGFSGCKGLRTITILGTPTIIGGMAFYNCTALTEFNIPESVTYIGRSAFGKCEGISNIIIPDSVERIDDYAFSQCINLESVKLGKNVQKIKQFCFSNCNMLKTISIDESIEIIERGAFVNCGNLSVIIYSGTKEQWDAIVKETRWDDGTGKYIVKCTDGTIEK